MQFGRQRLNLWDDLDGGRPGSHHGDPLAGQVDVMIPAGGMDDGAGKVGEPRDVGDERLVPRAARHDEERRGERFYVTMLDEILAPLGAQARPDNGPLPDLLSAVDLYVSSRAEQGRGPGRRQADRRNLGDGAVPAALGATAAQRPDVYRASSPLHRLPLGIPQVIVTARDDHPDLNDLNSRYAAAARAAGDTLTVIEGSGDHFTLIDPGSKLWADTYREMLAALAPGGGTGASGMVAPTGF